jgi:hypothetical protein
VTGSSRYASAAILVPIMRSAWRSCGILLPFLSSSVTHLLSNLVTLFLSDLVPFFWHLHSPSRCVYAEPEDQQQTTANQQQTIALIVIKERAVARRGRLTQRLADLDDAPARARRTPALRCTATRSLRSPRVRLCGGLGPLDPTRPRRAW